MVSKGERVAAWHAYGREPRRYNRDFSGRSTGARRAGGARRRPMLRIHDQLPAGLLDLDSTELGDALGGPALIRIPGERPQPLFVATLLHGNETTGWDAVRQVLRGYGARALPRSVLLFLGNVRAARERLRHLDGQPDYNRIWGGYPGPEGDLAAQVLAEVRRAHPFACLDLHNTSGENPLYTCVHGLDDASRALGRVFSRKLVLVTHPDTLLSLALSRFAPSVTLECGKPGNPEVTARVAAFLEEALALETLDAAHPALLDHPGEVLRSVARVRVPEHVSFSFDDDGADLRLAHGLDAHNFTLVPDGTPIGWIRHGADARLEALDATGADVSERYFRRDRDALVTASPLIPSLFTPNARIIRQDCLCYVMEPVD